MTKAAVRAMDTVQGFAAEAGKIIRDFLVLGGSKRGWTTWLTASGRYGSRPLCQPRSTCPTWASSLSTIGRPMASMRRRW